MSAITYAPDLVEEVVLLAERTLHRTDARAFRRERDRLYDVVDADRREADFRAFHMRWFVRLGLHHGIEESVVPRPEILSRVTVCRVSRALARRDEGADLIGPSPAIAGQCDAPPTLALRLRPSALLDRAALATFLAHELTHVADMLDPAFGYDCSLPPSDDGPSRDTILRDRYRVLWDVTIDGRLTRRGLGGAGAREGRRQEFEATFAMLGDEGPRVFDDWFDRIEPTHAALVAFAQAPNGTDSTNPADSGRCPLCHFPIAAFDTSPDRPSPVTQGIIRADYPAWRREHGLCTQCLNLYEARHEETAHANS
jgi:hypothetical protein